MVTIWTRLACHFHVQEGAFWPFAILGDTGARLASWQPCNSKSDAAKQNSIDGVVILVNAAAAATTDSLMMLRHLVCSKMF
jgi:hypothetical protein